MVNVRENSGTIDTGYNNDTVNVSANSGTIDTGYNNDTVNVSANSGTIDTGYNNDTVNVSTNSGLIDTGSSDDAVNVVRSSGTTNLFDGNDEFFAIEQVGTVGMGAGNDSATIESYVDGEADGSIDGGSGFDELSFTGWDVSDVSNFARSGEFGDFVNYASKPTEEALQSDHLRLSTEDLESVDWIKTSFDSNAVSDARLVGVSKTTVDVEDDLTVDYDVNGNSEADAISVSIGASAYSELITIGVEDSDFDAADGVSFDIDFGGVSSSSSSSTSEGSDAVAVSFGLGFNGTDGIADADANLSGSELDLAISNVSGVMADAESIVGDVMAVSSNDIVDATELMVVADASVQAALSADVKTISIATTTAGSSEAVGWQDVSVLEDSNVTSGGLGLIDAAAQAMNSVSAESVGADGVGVGGIATADAISHTTGITDTDFSFADIESSISADLSESTSASATSVFGDAVSSLTSSIQGIFGGSSPNNIENSESISAIVNEQGFAEASTVGGTAVSTADQSAEAISSYEITTSGQLTLIGESNLTSTTTSKVTED